MDDIGSPLEETLQGRLRLQLVRAQRELEQPVPVEVGEKILERMGEIQSTNEARASRVGGERAEEGFGAAAVLYLDLGVVKRSDEGLKDSSACEAGPTRVGRVDSHARSG